MPGLIAYYPLDETSGSAIHDAGPHQLNGACTHVRMNQPGAMGPSFSFDGSRGFCAVPSRPLLSPSRAFSVVALVKLRDLSKIYELFGRSAYNLNGFRVYTTTSRQLVFEVNTEAGGQALSTNFGNPNQWVFVVVTYDQHNQIIYLDGKDVKAQIGNPALNVLTKYNDKFSDNHGMRAYPWGFEPQEGYTNNSFHGDGVISMNSSNDNNATLFAVPDLKDKPIVFAGKKYTQSFEISYTITSGQGIRVMHQWFNTMDPGAAPFQSDYGQFLTGVSDWRTISLTATAPPGAVRGDIVLELWGTGELSARNPQFYLTDPKDAAVTTNTQPFLLGQATDGEWRMNGNLQHVAYFNRALSSSEVQMLARLFTPHTKS